ncbi:hypothetical protein G6F37_011905 [Rhizopus arrhizus]|nr:hypothetical protein G6F38_011620 [Rhizopus arrhizus]KAG1146782.1 hypothetical protein G6F37_011905 [Rhizopus arrhizus]
MSFPTLPDDLRPGKSLNNTENDYLVAESEWAIGTRSDLVLAPKCASSSLPPIIVEFQHRVDKKFMKRVIVYCIQVSDRYGMDSRKVRLFLKSSHTHTMNRDTGRTIQLRYKIITESKDTGVDFQKNCVFIDESGFNSHQIRTPLSKPSDIAKIEKEFPQPETKKRKAKNDQPAKTIVKKEAIQSRGYKPLFMPLTHHFLTLLKSAGLKLKRMSKETHHSPH